MVNSFSPALLMASPVLELAHVNGWLQKNNPTPSKLSLRLKANGSLMCKEPSSSVLRALLILSTSSSSTEDDEIRSISQIPVPFF